MSIPDAYDAHDATGLAALVHRRQVRPGELLDEALARVEARDPALNAVIDRFEHRSRDAIAAGLPDGPFTGVPFLLKDLDTHAAGELSTEGCRFFADQRAETTSEVVERFDAAGLVSFGKTNVPEFGLAPTTEPVLHGPTRNPWDLDRSVGGSSGGAAAAVAAGIVPMAHATDGGGSIRIPASAAGLVGLKPTRGRGPFRPWLSVDNVASRSVRDSAAALDALAGPGVVRLLEDLGHHVEEVGCRSTGRPSAWSRAPLWEPTLPGPWPSAPNGWDASRPTTSSSPWHGCSATGRPSSRSPTTPAPRWPSSSWRATSTRSTRRSTRSSRPR